MSASDPDRDLAATHGASADEARTSGPLLTAARFGRYAIVRLIGTGGMGAVYEATHVDLKKPVALKVIHPSFAADHAVRARFLREGEATSRIRHPHVVDVTDFGVEDGMPFLVMELLAGESLAARIKRDGPLSVGALADLLVPVCAAVAAAHQAGVIHRDLKPENVFLARAHDGRLVPKVVDFGVCKMSDREPAPALTTSNAVVGSPAYLSPEQIRSSRLITSQVDQYALGVVLYEASTGRLPFAADNVFAIIMAIVEGRYPPPREVRPDLPAELEALITRAMAKDPAARFGSVVELGAALLRFASPRTHLLWSASFAAEVDEGRATAPNVPGRPASAVTPAGHSLPAERDAFVGRAADLAQLASELGRGTRLVTVIGAGGTGKTRLVTRYGWDALAAWPGGVWFSDLAEARTLDGVAYGVGRSLGVPLSSEPITQLGDALAARGRCLVILDNFEQVARHAEATLGAWLDRAPAAQFVVTSREVLGLASEVVLALAPLDHDEAVALFVQRAAAARRGFEPTEEDRAAIAELVELLDCLPLAIELAATRVRMMPPRTILARMGQRFELLSSGGSRRDRQATLRATLDWSWHLLAPAEQAALAQLSVFEGGFTLEAVEAVLAVPDAWAGDLLQGLIDKSLTRQVSEARFDLLVSVHVYAAERLAELGGATEPERRHGDCFSALGSDESIDLLEQSGGAAALAALMPEVDNLAAACRRAIARGDAATAVATLTAAAEVLHRRGPASVALALVRAVAAMPSLDDRQRGRAMASLGSTLRLTGPESEVSPALEQAVAFAASSEDVRAECRARCELARALVTQGSFAAAGAQSETALARARARGDRAHEALALGVHALVDAERGRVDDSAAGLLEALAIDREVGNRRLEALHLSNIGFLELQAGRPAPAREHLVAAIALHDELGDDATAANARNLLALVLMRHGEPDLAREHLETAAKQARSVGSRKVEALIYGSLAELELQRGELDAARALLVRGEELLRAFAHRFMLAQILCRRAICEERAGDASAARAALVEAESIARELGVRSGSELGYLLAGARARP